MSAQNKPLVEAIRFRLFECIVPTYLLDESYYIVAWNPAFEELFAKPLKLKIGQHAADFVGLWENHEEALARSVKVFSVGNVPLVDHELGIVKLKAYGKVEMQKMATQVHVGEEMGWVVSYNIRSADKIDKLFDDMMKVFADRIRAESPAP